MHVIVVGCGRVGSEVALNLAEVLDDHDDVQNVYSDFDLSEDELARIAAGQ